MRRCLSFLLLTVCWLPALAQDRIDLKLDTSEAEAVLAILDRSAAGERVTDADWQRLFATVPYQRLQKREASLRRAFTDDDFRAFVLAQVPHRADLRRTLDAWSKADLRAAAARALRDLPAEARIRASVYPMIKPKPNSFVFEVTTDPAIFLYLDPEVPPQQFENTVAHELHHIGIAAACPDTAFPVTLTPARAMLLRFLGAFSEGEAMLAAAGSPAVHPHAADADSVKARWDRDVANASADIAALSQFFQAVLDGRISDADSVQRRAFMFYGTQGPWYTVGWVMASTVERELGRDALIAAMCDPVQLLRQYNVAAQRANGRGASLPLWDARLVRALTALRHPPA